MKITIAKSAGFCFGVRRALKIAYEAAQSGKNVCMLGDIVHNEYVVKEITSSGIKRIKNLSRGKNKILLVRAHGEPAGTYRKAKGLGYRIIDATCPMVKEIHTIARRAEKDGYDVIIIGDRKHDEVRGIIGQLRKSPLVIDAPGNIPLSKIQKIKKAAVVVQSTQEPAKTYTIVKTLRRHIPRVKFFDTICNPTRIKQKEVAIMPLQNDAMIIIGSRRSANTKRLYQIAKKHNKNSHWIQSQKQIRLEWFRKIETVGITAGASTPDATIQEVAAFIGAINRT